MADDLDYVPMPPSVKDTIRKSWAQIKDASGKAIPAWFISTVTAKANGKDVFKGEFGPAVSKDPFLNFKYKGAKGDKVTVSWVDNKGGKWTDEATVS